MVSHSAARLSPCQFWIQHLFHLCQVHNEFIRRGSRILTKCCNSNIKPEPDYSSYGGVSSGFSAGSCQSGKPVSQSVIWGPQGCWLLLSHINQRRFLPIDLISLWWNQSWQPWTVLIISTTCFPPLVHPSCAPTYWSCSARCQEPSAKQTESELINRCETRWGGLQKAGLAEGTCWQMQLPASGTAFLSFFLFPMTQLVPD